MSKIIQPKPTDWLASLDALPSVPSDRADVLAEAEKVPVSSRFPEANRAEGVGGLREIREGLSVNPNALGDIAPDGAECGRLADEIDHATRTIARLESLTEYTRAWRAAREALATKRIEVGYSQVTQRIELGRIQADAYRNLRAFVDARGAAVSEGIARSKAEKKTPDAPKPVVPVKDDV